MGSADAISRGYRRANRKASSAVPAADHTDASIETPAGRSLGRYLASHLGSTQVSRVIYGSIIGLALVVALEAHPPPPGAVIATLVGSAIAVGSPSSTASWWGSRCVDTAGPGGRTDATSAATSRP
jgi:hypothetical protein